MFLQNPSGQGFTLLLEVINRPTDYTTDEELLQDALLLINSRWNLNGYIETDEQGKKWGWVCCTRFLVSDNTIVRALGEMTPDYVKFTRGPVTQTCADARRLNEVKQRWNVQDKRDESELSADSYGPAPPWFKKQKK